MFCRLNGSINRNAIHKYTLAAAAQESLIEVFIDGISVKAPPNTAIIQACRLANKDIPRFCYHERLAIAGNCRMCLVHVDKMPKLVASCSQPIAAGMRITTSNDAVRKAREGVMEFLLANHPLDCPVCDQGGECDLQDQAMAYGSDRSRFSLDFQDKRAVEDKYLGPLVKTSMNRCIHCTRCVRFANELAGVPDLGTTGRGNDMQIGTYVEKAIKSELSGNIIDLCPVGALTSRPYAFQARPWELKKTGSIDVMDAIGSSIRIDTRGPQVYRILPMENPNVNEEWLADKSRFACDALSLQRLSAPLIKIEQDSQFQEADWADALAVTAERMKNADPSRMQAIVGDFADAETMFLTKELFSSMMCRNLSIDADNPNIVLSNSALGHLNCTLNDIESRADCLLIIGSNPRHEAPILNLRIRKNYLNNDKLKIGLVGEKLDLTYEYEHLGESFNSMLKFEAALSEARYPIVIVAQSALVHCAHHLKDLFTKCSKLNRLAVLNRTASRTAALKLGFGAEPPILNPQFTLLLNAAVPKKLPGFTVFIGHHADQTALNADVIFPAAAYTEKDATYLNAEGRLQSTTTAIPPLANARVDWTIIRALSEYAGQSLPFDSLQSIRRSMHGEFGLVDNGMSPHVTGNQKIIDDLDAFLKANPPRPISAFKYPIEDYYMTDIISRHSPTMAKCSRELR